MRLSSLIAIVLPLIFSVVGVWSFSDGGPLKKGFGAVSRSPQASNNVPVPKVLEPSKGTSKLAIEKFLMMYTCKVCSGRNAQMVSKIAYNQGMVISTCRTCKKRHLIADNEKKLDFGKDYGQKIEDYLLQNGEKVQKFSLSKQQLEDYYLVDQDGELTLVPKATGEISADSTVVNFPPEYIP